MLRFPCRVIALGAIGLAMTGCAAQPGSDADHMRNAVHAFGKALQQGSQGNGNGAYTKATNCQTVLTGNVANTMCF